jgi:hypothetical protein
MAVTTLSPLSRKFPPAVPSGKQLVQWEHETGEARTATHALVYELWVDPGRPGLYAITHYRVSLLDGSHRRDAHEVLLWNAAPGEPLRCFQRVSYRPIWALGLWRRWKWRVVPRGSASFDAEMRRAIEVYALQRQRLGL